MGVVTIPIAASDMDGTARKTASTVYPPNTAAALNTANQWLETFKNFATPNYEVWGSVYRFDTSAITGTVLSATLDIYVNFITNTNSRSLAGEWLTDGVLATTDYVDDVGTTAHAGTTIASLSGAGVKSLALLNPDSNINKGGTTKLRLGVTGAAPTGGNEVWVAGFDHATLVEPRLLVTIPDVEYDPAIIHATTGARW